MINILNPKFSPSIHVIKKLLKYLIYGVKFMQKVEEEDNGWEGKFYLIFFFLLMTKFRIRTI